MSFARPQHNAKSLAATRRKALASETRQAILVRFATQPTMTVNQIAEAVGVSQPTASEHLAILRRAGLPTATRAGKEVLYRTNYPAMVSSAEQLLAYLKACGACEPPPGSE